MKTNLFFPLAVGLVITIVTIIGGYYFTRTAPDLRYILSDSIPVSFLNPSGSPEIIQQLEVKNLGNAKAERIQIKIKGLIASYKLDPYSQDDKPAIFNQDGNFELIYPELPPQGGFKLTLKAQNSDISQANLQVSDNVGPGQAALTRANPTWWFLGIYSGVVALMIFGSVLSFIATTAVYKELSLRHVEMAEVLRLTKPWYLRGEKWKQILNSVIEYKIAKDYASGDHMQTASYTLVSLEKPTALDDDVWDARLRDASKRFEELYAGRLSYAHSDNILRLLDVTKPVQFNEFEWEQLVKLANDRYYEAELRVFWEVRDVLAALRREKPDKISDATWTKIDGGLQKRLYDLLESKIYRSSQPVTYVEGFDLSVLDDETSIKIRKLAFEQQYRFSSWATTTLEQAKTFLSWPKPVWLDDEKYSELKLRAEKVIQIEENETDYESRKKELEKESETRNEEHREMIIKLEDELRDRLQNQTAIVELRSKIQNQLEIIDTILNHPQDIDRIEDYSHSFAPGNFENLKKLAEKIKNSAE